MGTPLVDKRILVVEDEALIAIMLAEMLGDLGARVIGPACTVAAGLSLAEAEVLDAAVLDINVGGERVDVIAELLVKRGVPIVFATGYATAPPNGGRASHIISKPYTQDSLAHGLRQAMGI
jgi:CheY-like chemotaxis protein